MGAALPHRLDEGPALRSARDGAGARPAVAAAGVLGALAYALPPTQGGLGLRHLAGGGVDTWFAGAAVHHGGTGALRWRSDGEWLFGQIDIDDIDPAGSLAGPAHDAYRQLFAALRDAGRPRLLRLWNYLPRINAHAAGLERYRQFNIGRQQAFIDAGEDAFEGAPAACALGRQEGDTLSVRFLAGRRAAVPLDNPRQVPAYRYSAQHGPRSPTFSRAVLADAGRRHVALLVSGTASIVGQDSVHPGDPRAQTRETIANLGALLDAVHRHSSAHVDLGGLDCTVYVRDAAHGRDVREVFESAVGAASHAARSAIYLQADICRRELLVEIEAHAVAAGVLAP